MSNRRILISGSQPFQVTKHNFMIGVCPDAYTLQVSVDYIEGGAPENYTWSDYSSEIAASSGPHDVGPVASNLFWRLNGNTSDVFLVF